MNGGFQQFLKLFQHFIKTKYSNYSTQLSQNPCSLSHTYAHYSYFSKGFSSALNAFVFIARCMMCKRFCGHIPVYCYFYYYCIIVVLANNPKIQQHQLNSNSKPQIVASDDEQNNDLNRNRPTTTTTTTETKPYRKLGYIINSCLHGIFGYQCVCVRE
ncbi:unnamed protein product [Ceratitis capitata]|uniref:(Mediterranean fruit fly) hypothetical protein n=1 Tax=Ceratitis capitata TaxID=7213 RepID=A0A811U7J8_CERCA|nr:unnamed protein product [Ceratitis capitata]